jgi:predicted transcriptional regulator
MGPIRNTGVGQIVRASDKIADIAPAVIEAGSPVPVIDERDRVVGSLAPQAVIDTLIGKDARA